jgi:hypothetical protein
MVAAASSTRIHQVKWRKQAGGSRASEILQGKDDSAIQQSAAGQQGLDALLELAATAFKEAALDDDLLPRASIK